MISMFSRISQSAGSANPESWHSAAALFRRAVLGLAVVVGAGVFSAGAVRAGGLYANEFGTTAQANAGAGRGAWAPDASAALHNPAVMTELDTHSFAAGATVAYADIQFDAQNTSPNGTEDGGNQGGFAPIGSFSYVHRISDRLRFGLSVYSLAGAKLNPKDDWAGRFELTKLSLLTVEIAPNIAIRITDWLSIGGGPVANYGVLNWDLKAPFPPNSESYVRFDTLDDWAPSGRVGVFLKPREDLAVSVVYTSKTDFKLRGHVDGPIGLNRSFSTDLPLAEFVEANIAWKYTDKLTLLAIVDWENWSEGNKLSVSLQGNTTKATTGFRDTFKIGLGANYQLTDKWLLQTGLTFDNSAFENQNRTTVIPIDKQIRFALGAQHALTDSLNLGFSFVYLNLGQGEVRDSTVRGDYNRNSVFMLGCTLAFNKLPWNGKLTYTGKGI
jgi:long-chain fatty acid transport protein